MRLANDPVPRRSSVRSDWPPQPCVLPWLEADMGNSTAFRVQSSLQLVISRRDPEKIRAARRKSNVYVALSMNRERPARGPMRAKQNEGVGGRLEQRHREGVPMFLPM